MRVRMPSWLALALFLLGGLSAQSAQAQSFGVELFNTLTPAAGGMAGTSIARPQDVVAAINGNPASLSQYRGTNFTLGGAWAGSTLNIQQTAPIPNGSPNPLIQPFSAKSETPGSALPNIGVSQDYSALGMPITLGIAMVGSAGGGTSFRQNTASNGTNTYLTILNFVTSASVQVTDRWSLGTSLIAGTGFADGPFVGAGGMTAAFAIRGSVGINYALTENTNLGFYYQTKEHFRFKDETRLLLLNGLIDTSRDLRVDLPDNFGIGLSNSTLMDGRLLLAADVLWIQWRNADLFRDVYINQWVLQVGSQYSLTKKIRLRSGYALAENSINRSTGDSVDGITPPGGLLAVKYLQAQYGVINQHRISAGVGMVDVLPGVDIDTYAGGMFKASQHFGEFTSVNVESYWIGLGITWRFGRGDSAYGPWKS